MVRQAGAAPTCGADTGYAETGPPGELVRHGCGLGHRRVRICERFFKRSRSPIQPLVLLRLRWELRLRQPGTRPAALRSPRRDGMVSVLVVPVSVFRLFDGGRGKGREEKDRGCHP